MFMSFNFKNWSIGLLNRVPARTKRVILLASITAGIKEKPDLDPATIRKLNELLQLCSNEKALSFPAHLSTLIWDGQVISMVKDDLENKEVMNSNCLSDMVARFKQRIPAWLRYEDAELDSDLKKLFKNFDTLLAH